MTDLKGKKLLVLGGTKISCEIVRAAHKLGVLVGVTDYNKVEDSPAKQIADYMHSVSCTDVSAVVNLIREEGYDGVIVGFADILLPYYADICEKANLPCYGTRSQFETFIDKKIYKSLCVKYHVPVVPDIDSRNLENPELRDNLPFPIILKPSNSSGARGITICKSKDDLNRALKKAKDFSSNQKFIAEPYLEGEEVTVFWFFQNGRYFVSMIGNRHMREISNDSIPLPVGYTFPSYLSSTYLKEVKPKAENMFRDLDIRDGMMFMQCKVINQTCLAYDIGYRLTGSLEYKIIEKCCGYNPLNLMIEHALTGSNEIVENRVDPFLNGKVGWNVSFLMKPGKIADIIGLENVRKLPDVLDAVVAHEVGEEIKDSEIGLLKQICCRLLGVSDSVIKATNEVEKATNLFLVKDERGENLLYEPLDISQISNKIAKR